MKEPMDQEMDDLIPGKRVPEPEKINHKGEINLDHPEAIILDALGIMRFHDVVKDKKTPLAMADLFGGPVKMGAWEAVQEYITSGSKGRLSPQEEHYLDLLNLVYSLDTQYGKRNVIRFLTSAYFGFSYNQASNLYSEAIEMFYANRNISKDALRQKTADQLEAAYIAAITVARTAKDYKNAAEILRMRAEVLGLDREDTVVLSQTIYRRTYRILSLDPESIGLPKANRRELKEIIDEVLVSGAPDTERKRIEMDAGIIDMDIQEIMENESQEAD